MTLRIPVSVLRTVETAAARRFPEEACGLLVGRDAPGAVVVSTAYESANLADDRCATFDVDPGLRLRLQRRVREAGERVVGLFHSHPNGSAAPSDTDRGSIWEDDLVWLIVAVADGVVTETRAFAADQAARDFRSLEMRAA